MTTTKENGTLSEIRQEYKDKKKQLEKYDTFIDRHQGLVVGMPLLLVIIGVLVLVGVTEATSEQMGDSLAIRGVGLLSIVLLVVAITLAFITGSRKSAKAKIDKRLEILRQEAVVFQKHAENHNDAGKDELGLQRDIEQNDSGSDSKISGATAFVGVLLIISALLTVNYIANRNSGTNDINQAATQQESQIQANQAQCLNDAHVVYMEAWSAADKDGDGSIAYSDGATEITTTYFDAAISCYRTHRTSDSDGYIADYQAKRQQEVDKYNTWVQAMGNAASRNSSQSNYRSSMSCTSRSIGSSVYTDCY